MPFIRENKTYQIPSVIETNGQQGMQTLDQALESAVRNGIIEFEEALLRAQRPEDLEKAFAGRNLHNGKPKEFVGKAD